MYHHNINVNNLKNDLIKYFENLSQVKFDLFESIVNQNNSITCRQLEKLPLQSTNSKYKLSYEANYKIYGKMIFDVFRRPNKFSHTFKNGSSINTSVGQLNYFRWLFESELL